MALLRLLILNLLVASMALSYGTNTAAAGLTSSFVQSQGSGVTREDAINAALVDEIAATMVTANAAGPVPQFDT